MLELAMAAFRASVLPAVVFEEPEDIADFHRAKLSAALRGAA